MASPKQFPNFLRGAVAIGLEPFLPVAERFGIPAPAGISVDALALAVLRALKNPNDVFGHLDTSDELYERVGLALGLGPERDWKPKQSAEEIAKLPFYLQPSYAQEVINVFMLNLGRPRPVRRAAPPRPAHAGEWPELSSIDAWRKLGPKARRAVAARLAGALGLESAGETGADELALLRDPRLGIDYVALPGGRFQMGLSPAEARDLNKRAKTAGPEAVEHAKALAKLSRPVHEVDLAPFLVSALPLSAAAARSLGAAPTTFPGGVARVDGEDAAAVVQAARARLLSEAEWEYVGRAGGEHSWLSGKDDPRAFIEALAADPSPASEAHPLGVRGLAWGEWVDDGWHRTYDGAPVDGRAWEPCLIPTVARGGALALWPWQVGGEVVLCHAAARGEDHDEQCVRLALDLPSRRG